MLGKKPLIKQSKSNIKSVKSFYVITKYFFYLKANLFYFLFPRRYINFLLQKAFASFNFYPDSRKTYINIYAFLFSHKFECPLLSRMISASFSREQL